MSGGRPLRVHAIYAVLDDVPLFAASVASIYPYVSGITVITTHDRDWMGQEREPSALVATMLSRELDPDRKIDLIVANETNEARTRNRAMDFAAPRRSSIRVRRQSDHDRDLVPPDYFLIIDADEIYEGAAFERLVAFVARDRRPLYRVACVRYFKRWNYRIDGLEWTIAFVRADQRLRHLRLRRRSLPRRAAARVPGLPSSIAGRLRGFVDIPPDVGLFHHGSYVGPRTRIEDKLRSFGHHDQIAPRWLSDVYDAWTPESCDFNPMRPELFPRAEHVDVSALPPEIGQRDWPVDYVDS